MRASEGVSTWSWRHLESKSNTRNSPSADKFFFRDSSRAGKRLSKGVEFGWQGE